MEFDADFSQAIAVVGGVGDRLDDLSQPLNEFVLWKEGQLDQNFTKQVDPDGNPWEPLAESTLDDKRRRGAPLIAMVDTNTLRPGIAAQPATRNEASVASTAGREYGILHQKGEGVPQRSYMGWSPGDPEVATGMIVNWAGL